MNLGSPTFRSAAIMHDIPAPRGWPQQQNQGTASFLYQQKTPPATSHSWPPPPKSIRDSSLLGGDIHPPPVAQDAAARWTWKLDRVSLLPMFYPIQERNTLTLVGERFSLNIITACISEFLRLNSIAGEYNDSEGSVRCRTTSLVEFVINLWQNRTTPALLVHVQRISGCSIQLNSLQTDLREAILNPDMSEASFQRTKPYDGNIGATIRNIDMQIPQEQEMETTHNKQSPLGFCRDLLSSNQLCERRLGLESLAMLTDRSKTINSAVREASNAVLFDSYFQSALASSLMASSSNDPGTDSSCSYTNGNHVLALQILAQSLQVFNSTSPTRIACSENQFFWGPVLTALLRNIQNAPSRPLEACLSVQCFGGLNDTAQVLGPSDAGNFGEHLHSAHQFGIQHNASLEKETRQLLGRLQSTVQ